MDIPTVVNRRFWTSTVSLMKLMSSDMFSMVDARSFSPTANMMWSMVRWWRALMALVARFIPAPGSTRTCAPSGISSSSVFRRFESPTISTFVSSGIVKISSCLLSIVVFFRSCCFLAVALDV